MPAECKLTGRCMCGSVSIRAISKKPNVTVCHCDMCRRWSSGPYMAITCQQVSIDGEECIGKIRSSDWAERGFCTKCGSNLYYHIIDSSDYQISAGLIDDTTELRMSTQVFTDNKPKFYEFANKTKMMTAADVFTKYAPRQR
jgi:hypothetical protein